MNCPFCAEEIKEEALVCPHCQRDLAFFRPMEKRLRVLETRLDVVAATLLEIRGQLQAQPMLPPADERVPEPIRRLSGSRKALTVLVEVLLTLAVVGILVALNVTIRPQPLSVVPYYQNPAARSSFSDDQQESIRILASQEWIQRYDSYLRRWKIIISIFLPTLFLIPIGIGLGMGLRWPGRNLKWYIVLGAAAGTIEVLGFIALMLVIYGATPDLLPLTALFLGINIARCVFGFVAGGLIGDSIEKRRLRARSQPVLLAGVAGIDPEHWADVVSAGNQPRSRLKILTDAVPMASVLSLVGVVVTSYFTYLATTHKAKDANSIPPGAVSQSTPVKPTPFPSPTGSPSR